MITVFDIYRPFKALRLLIKRRRSELEPLEQQASLSKRLLEVFLRTWDLGFTAFGGPPVHFQIIYHRFVEGKGGKAWIDEQTVSEFPYGVTLLTIN
jgi:hypothetical protein